MNSQHSDTALLGLKSTALALSAVAESGDSKAGPETAEQSRLTFEKHWEEAKARFGEYFAGVIQSNPVLTEREKEQARQGKPLDQ